MVSQLQKPRLLSDLDWVISITKSAKSKDQLQNSLKCYLLWEKKYEPFLEGLSNKGLPLRGVFWALYKNKESEFSVMASSLR